MIIQLVPPLYPSSLNYVTLFKKIFYGIPSKLVLILRVSSSFSKLSMDYELASPISLTSFPYIIVSDLSVLFASQI